MQAFLISLQTVSPTAGPRNHREVQIALSQGMHRRAWAHLLVQWSMCLLNSLSFLSFLTWLNQLVDSQGSVLTFSFFFL